jgi:hypothetical protein
MAAPTIAKQTLDDSRHRVIVKVVIPSGGDTNLSSTEIIDASAFTGGSVTSADLAVYRVDYSLGAALELKLEFNASSNVEFLHLAGQGSFCFTGHGGAIQNNAGAGKNGDIDMSTVGLAGAVNPGGTVILYCYKK